MLVAFLLSSSVAYLVLRVPSDAELDFGAGAGGAGVGVAKSLGGRMWLITRADSGSSEGPRTGLTCGRVAVPVRFILNTGLVMLGVVPALPDTAPKVGGSTGEWSGESRRTTVGAATSLDGVACEVEESAIAAPFPSPKGPNNLRGTWTLGYRLLVTRVMVAQFEKKKKKTGFCAGL